MRILASEIEGYQKLRENTERILTECQSLTDFPNVHKTIGINLGKDYADIYLAFEEFQKEVLMDKKIQVKDYIFKVGVLEGRLSTRIKSIQTVGIKNLELKSKLEKFMIAKSAVIKYLLSIMD